MSRGQPETRRRILEAAAKLLQQPGGVDVRMGQIADEAGVSRQALYLHFADRSQLLVAAVGHVDETAGLADKKRPIEDASTAREAIDRYVQMHAEDMPRIADVARAMDAARRTDPAIDAAWQDRLSGRRRYCRRLAARLQAEGDLADGWTVDDAADLLLLLISPRSWDDLVTERGWPPSRYIQNIQTTIHSALVAQR